MGLREQVVKEINEQILSLMSSKSVSVSFAKPADGSFEEQIMHNEKLKIMAEMETLEEGFLIINKNF